MYYSLTFTNSQNEKKNTWDDWQLIPTYPPMIESPPLASNYINIPGGVPIDVTEWLTGKPAYGNSEGSWSFVCAGDVNRMELFRELKAFLHGQALKVALEEDPFHYYQGRFSVSAPQTGDINTSFQISYTIGPVRYAYDGTQDGI